jgi:uncharacterized membrane protein
LHWTHLLGPMLAAFLASLVECIEALTVILAVGAVLGWRGALTGAALAVAVLLAMVAILGPALTLIPLAIVHLAIGALLLVFGARWLRKAVLRAAGVIPKRDETVAYARQAERLRSLQPGAALAATFQVTMIEGLEVVFIVLATSAADASVRLPASLGALAALILVCALGIALHRPIARIPENALKFMVGVLACAFGLFWLGEGLGLHWPGQDWSLLGLAAVILGAAAAAAQLVRAGEAR